MGLQVVSAKRLSVDQCGILLLAPRVQPSVSLLTYALLESVPLAYRDENTEDERGRSSGYCASHGPSTSIWVGEQGNERCSEDKHL